MANEDIEQTLNAQIRFGVDPASTADVKAGLDDIKGELAKTNENVKQIAGNFSNAAQTAKGFIAAGRALKAIGGLIGNEEISKMGKYVTMVGRLTMSYARLIPMMQKLLASQSSLAKLGLTGAAVAGGAFIGAQIYDKMIGPNQQTMNYKTGQMEANTAGNILNQTAAVFSRDMTLVAATLRGDSHAAETANKAFLDTAKMYGIIKTDAEVQIEVQEKLKEKYGSLTLAAIALADKLEHAAKVALASGDVFQEMGGMMKDAASQIIRASASVAAMNDPLVKAYDESQKARAKVDKAYYQDNIKAQAEGMEPIPAGGQSGGGGSGRNPEGRLVTHIYSDGVITGQFKLIARTVNITGKWETTWTPPEIDPAAKPELLKPVCLDLPGWKSIIQNPPALPKLPGRLAVYGRILEDNQLPSPENYGVLLTNLDGSQKQVFGQGVNPSASADGTTLAYNRSDGLHLVDTSSGKNALLPGLNPDDFGPKLSPDGRETVGPPKSSGPNVHPCSWPALAPFVEPE